MKLIRSKSDGQNTAPDQSVPRHTPDQHPPEVLEPEVMPSEIRAAIKKLKVGKAAGLDGTSGEMIKAGGETVIQAIKTIIDNIWRTGVWPSAWTQSEIITLPKVPGTQDCSKHRTISLICHASKVLLEVIRSRLAHFVMSQIAEEQFGLGQLMLSSPYVTSLKKQ